MYCWIVGEVDYCCSDCDNCPHYEDVEETIENVEALDEDEYYLQEAEYYYQSFTENKDSLSKSDLLKELESLVEKSVNGWDTTITLKELYDKIKNL